MTEELRVYEDDSGAFCDQPSEGTWVEDDPALLWSGGGSKCPA